MLAIRFSVELDANVLVSAVKRDLILILAQTEMTQMNGHHTRSLENVGLQLYKR